VKVARRICNSDRIEEETVGGVIPNDSGQQRNNDAPKLKHRKLENTLKTCVNKSFAMSFIKPCLSFLTVSIRSDEI
jgi:hypothetical protein